LEIDDALAKIREANMSPDKARIYKFIQDNSTEVFLRGHIAKALKMNYDTVKKYVHELRISGDISYYKVEGKRLRFYGTPDAIEMLEQRVNEGTA